jgi:hypothetical protein
MEDDAFQHYQGGSTTIMTQKTNLSNKGQNKHKWEMSTNDNKGKLLTLKGECTLQANHFPPLFTQKKSITSMIGLQ